MAWRAHFANTPFTFRTTQSTAFLSDAVSQNVITMTQGKIVVDQAPLYQASTMCSAINTGLLWPLLENEMPQATG